MASKKRRKSHVQSTLAGLLLALLAAMIVLSLATHSPRDLGPDSAGAPTVENASGLVGAYVSGALFRAFGPIGAWAIPLVIFLWGVNRLRRTGWAGLALRCAIASGFFIVILCLLSLWTGGSDVRWGGGLGDWIGGLVTSAFGSLGAHFFLWAILLSLTFVVSDVPIRVLSIVGEALLAGVGALTRAAVKAAGAAAGAIKSMVASKREAARRPKVVRRTLEINREQPRSAAEERSFSEGPEIVGATARLDEPPAVEETRERAQPLVEATVEEPAVTAVTEGEGDDSPYELPPLSYLTAPDVIQGGVSEGEVLEASKTLRDALSHFGVRGTVAEVHPGPVITRYDFEPAAGIRVSQIISRQDDIALALRCQNIRIVAPIPGKAAVGIEVPNKLPQVVYLKELLTGSGFTDSNAKLLLALGKTVSGRPYYADLGSMPHLLIAGATGSGKSVCVNTIIMSLLYRLTADELKLLLIDPKRLELSGYNGIPHLLLPVVTDHKKAAGALRWVVHEMDRRYKHLATVGVRDIESYNSKAAADPEGKLKRLPLMVIVVDELADLMVALPAEIEEPVTRLAQMARAVGIHLILATQRPSVDVITGLIKANFPSRIAFQVAAKVDSRTILDTNGAECLLGKGDMLFLPGGVPQPVRIHAAFVSPDEISAVTTFLRDQVSSEEVAVPEVEIEQNQWEDTAGDEEIFKEAAKLVVLHQQGSTSLLQRRLRIGYSRAARIVDMLEQRGIVGPFKGSKAREVLVDEEYLRENSLI